MRQKILSPQAEARQKRQQLAAKEGAQALAQYEAEAVAIRKNMARLRALRLAKEAEGSDPAPKKAPAKPRKG